MTLRVRGGDIDRARSYKVMLHGLTKTALADPILVAWVDSVAERLLEHGELTGDQVDELRPADNPRRVNGEPWRDRRNRATDSPHDDALSQDAPAT